MVVFAWIFKLFLKLIHNVIKKALCELAWNGPTKHWLDTQLETPTPHWALPSFYAQYISVQLQTTAHMWDNLSATLCPIHD